MAVNTIVIEDNIVTSTFETIQQEIQAVIDSGSNEITLDISNVTVIDSTGIGLLIRIQNSLKNMDGKFCVIGVNDDIYRMFKIMRLDEHITMETL